MATPASVGHLAKGLPFTAKRAFGLATGLQAGRLDVAVPDGRVFRFGGRSPGPAAQMRIHDLHFARRLPAGGDIGMAEGFLAGEWDSPDLTSFLALFCVNRSLLFGDLAASPVRRVLQAFGHWRNRNTRGQARRNITAHYDLGNAFYAAWLDRTMTYSSALFEGGALDLTAAQERKYGQLARDVGLSPDHSLLEIGAGWGGFAEFVARTIGCRVTGLTISPAQHDFARRRIFEAGLADRVEIKLLDYRDERGQYDRIASIEMFEAVGEAWWPTYFRQLRERLRPGGLAGLQVITVADPLFESYRRDLDFIRKYVFPGGMLPSPAILHRLGAAQDLRIVAERMFGHDYATTLRLWRERFRSAWPSLVGQGFDERFRRLWEYYLAYCEAGFTTGMIDVRQIVLAAPG